MYHRSGNLALIGGIAETKKIKAAENIVSDSDLAASIASTVIA